MKFGAVKRGRDIGRPAHASHQFMLVKCSVCGKGLWSLLRSGRPKWSKHQKCSGLAGDKHPNWKGGRHYHSHDGHIRVYAPRHPRANNGRVYEHIVVMESAIGRFLTKTERVHHINGVPDDNAPSNLFLCRDESHHRAVHHSLQEAAFELVKRGMITFRDGAYFVDGDESMSAEKP